MVNLVADATEGPWTIAGAVAAIAAATFALISLTAIWKQIRLAREEIDLVREDLSNSKEVLKYAKEQSALVQAQMAELRQRARLVLWADSIPMGRYDFHAPSRLITLTICNRGTRATSTFTVQLRLPRNLAIDASNRGSWRITDAAPYKGVHRTVIEADFKRLLLPDIPVILVAQSFVIGQGSEVTEAPDYRILHRDGAKADSAWSTLTTNADAPSDD